MFEVKKASTVVQKAADEAAMEAVNRLSKRSLAPEEVYIFTLRACDDLPDRDYERFTQDCLEGLAELFVGKTVICDHAWSAKMQIARVFAAEVVTEQDCAWLRLDCYMPRSGDTIATIEAIETGILKEVSVGCAISRVSCSICGEPYGTCNHRRGVESDGAICIAELSEPRDAYEVSFVAVPAQPQAGVVKGKSEGTYMDVSALEYGRNRIRLERARFG